MEWNSFAKSGWVTAMQVSFVAYLPAQYGHPLLLLLFIVDFHSWPFSHCHQTDTPAPGEKFKGDNFSKLIVFTENRQLSKIVNLKENIHSFYSKFPKTNIDKFLFQNIKNKKDLIFKGNKSAFLINVTFPRKKSRANTFMILSKKDFQ